MKPKSQETAGQSDLFNTRLADLLNPRHELYWLANLIDWQVLDNEFGQLFSPDLGAPALPTRLVAGLHYLKHAFACSDEAVVERWVENPYWQYLCGEEFFRHQLPCHPTSLTKWRNRIGEAGCAAGAWTSGASKSADRRIAGLAHAVAPGRKRADRQPQSGLRARRLRAGA